eukprot:jgi/Mesen1/7375/ME000382S06578
MAPEVLPQQVEGPPGRRVRRKGALEEGSGGDGQRQQASTFADLPSSVGLHIMSLITDVRTRNCMALVHSAWRDCERQTRCRLVVRGHVLDALSLPRCFAFVTDLDLSLMTPWGHSYITRHPRTEIEATLRAAFPEVRTLRAYVRDREDAEVIASIWPRLEQVAFVRFHSKMSRPPTNLELGAEIAPVLASCARLRHLDLSQFFCWNDDVPCALAADGARLTARGLRVLNLRKLTESGFDNSDLESIARACPELEDLRCVCNFDPRFSDCVSDAGLQALGESCRGLRTLHLVDTCEWDSPHDCPEAPTAGEPRITLGGLEALFRSLPGLLDLTLLLCQELRQSATCLAALAASCKGLRALTLGRFLDLSLRNDAQGLAQLTSLRELEIRSAPGLSDENLAAVAARCTSLARLALTGCPDITPNGIARAALALRQTLKEVAIASCRRISTPAALQALAPLKPRLESLQLDCVWSPPPVGSSAGDAREEGEEAQEEPPLAQGPPVRSSLHLLGGGGGVMAPQYSEAMGHASTSMAAAAYGGRSWGGVMPGVSFPGGYAGDRMTGSGGGGGGRGSDLAGSSSQSSGWRGGQLPGPGSYSATKEAPPAPWERLRRLSLWSPIGKLLGHLPQAGLQACPRLQEVSFKVEGDSRTLALPAARACGLGCLAAYPALESLCVDLSCLSGYYLSAPLGFKDVRMWERFYLQGVQELVACRRLDYWPPSDHDQNRHELSLPSAGILSMCARARRLRVHGTGHEHFLSLFLRMPELRDLQIVGDYFPAPEDESFRDSGLASSKRLESQLQRRGWPD